MEKETSDFLSKVREKKYSNLFCSAEEQFDFHPSSPGISPATVPGGMSGVALSLLLLLVPLLSAAAHKKIQGHQRLLQHVETIAGIR